MFQVDESNYYPESIYSNETAFGSSILSTDSEKAYWGDVVVFTDDLFIGESKNIAISFWSYSYSEGSGPERQIKFQFSSISEGYYWYKKSQSVNRDSDDFFGGEPVQIYTNIQNGLGVFVGKTLEEHLFVIE